MSTETKTPVIETLIEKLEATSTIDRISSEDSCIEIEYSNNLSVFEKFGYTLDNTFNEPEQYQLAGKIEITFKGDQIENSTSNVDVYDCHAAKGQGDWTGYELDLNYEKESVEDFLTQLLADCEKLEQYSVDAEIEVCFCIHTNPSDAYRDSFLEIGKRKNNDRLFFSRGDNHQAHDYINRIGAAKWLPLEMFEDLAAENEWQLCLGDWLEYANEEQSQIIKTYVE